MGIRGRWRILLIDFVQDFNNREAKRDLSETRYVYLWSDGIYSNVRQDDRLCQLVVIGVTEHGRKELIAVEDGYRESEGR